MLQLHILLHLMANALAGLKTHLHQTHHRLVQPQTTLFHTRQVQDIVHHCHQSVRILVDVVLQHQSFLFVHVLAGNAVKQIIKSDDGIKRCSDLMTDVVKKNLFQLFLFRVSSQPRYFTQRETECLLINVFQHAVQINNYSLWCCKGNCFLNNYTIFSTNILIQYTNNVFFTLIMNSCCCRLQIYAIFPNSP